MVVYIYIFHPLAQILYLHSSYLHCVVVFFLVVVVVVVVVDVCVCGGGGCGSGVAVVVKCTGISQRKYKLTTKKPRTLAKKGSLNCYTMAHEQSACTHTFAHAVA